MQEQEILKSIQSTYSLPDVESDYANYRISSLLDLVNHTLSQGWGNLSPEAIDG